jgi:hypothetical protein
MLQSGVRPVEAWVHTTEFAIHGSFYLRERAGTATLLNAEERPYLPMTTIDVHRPPGAADPAGVERIYSVPFAAIPKAHVVWVVGGAPDVTQEGHGRQPRTVYLLYPDFALTGNFHMRPELRLSDFIGQSMVNKPFVTLHDVRVLRPAAPETPLAALEVVVSHEFATVNLRHAGAVLDQRDGEGSSTAR